MQSDVLVIGELNVDILLNKLHSFPKIGEEILADEMTFTLGSSSAIFAANLSSLGVKTAFAGMVGADMFGKYILDQLAAKSVDCRFIISEANYQTGMTIILNFDQDRANVTHCGAMEHFSLNDLPLSNLDEFRHLHLSSYFLQKALQPDIVEIFRRAKALGLTTSLDLQWDPANRWDFPSELCLPYVDFFIPNEAELLALTGCETLEQAFGKLKGYSNAIVVKRGIKGALAFNNGEITEAAPYLHNQFVDAIGAGDSFNAGFIKGFLDGRSLHENMLLGNLAGAVNTTAAGGTGAFSDLRSFKNKAKNIFNAEV